MAVHATAGLDDAVYPISIQVPVNLGRTPAEATWEDPLIAIPFLSQGVAAQVVLLPL
jgi:GTP cyclohydrolase III